jgi:tetratricopeptide (TPR) repeat protein
MLAAGLFALALLAGCASKPAPIVPSVEAVKPATVAAATPLAPPAQPASAAAPEPVAAAAEPKPAAAPVEAELPPLPAAVQQAFNAALALQRERRDAEALAAWRALLRDQPLLAGAHANLGLLHRRAGRLDDAIAALEQAVKLSPRKASQATFGNQLGITLRQAGRYAEARRAYEAALAAQSEHAASHFNLAILLDVYLGERDAALGHYQRAQLLLPEQATQVQRWVAELKARKPDEPVALKKEKE